MGSRRLSRDEIELIRCGGLWPLRDFNSTCGFWPILPSFKLDSTSFCSAYIVAQLASLEKPSLLLICDLVLVLAPTEVELF